MTNPARSPCLCGRPRMPRRPACPKCWREYLDDPTLPALERELRLYRATAKTTEPRPLSPHAKKWRFPRGWSGS